VREASWVCYWQRNTVADWCGLGYAAACGAVTDPKAWVCPSGSINLPDVWKPLFIDPSVGFSYNALWPPKALPGATAADVVNAASPTGSANTGAFGYYSIRSIPPQTLKNAGGNPSYTKWQIAMFQAGGGPTSPAIFKLANTQFPATKVIDMGARSALASDMFQGPAYLNAEHVDGIEVAYMDGSVRWQKKQLFDMYVNGPCPTGVFPMPNTLALDPPGNPAWNATFTDVNVGEIWKILDNN
jgi:hypothetical protein